MCKEIVLYNDCQMIKRTEIIENGLYKNYFVRDYLSGDDELGRSWNGYYSKEV